MEFTTERINQIQKALEKINFPKSCNICGKGIMTINTAEYQLLCLERKGSSLTLNLQSVTYKPAVCVCCNNCGAIQMFDLATLIGPESIIMDFIWV